MRIQHSADPPTNARHALDFEPRILELLEGRLVRRTRGPYQPLTNAAVEGKLINLLCAKGHRDSTLTELARMAGGASKEQFCFTLITAEGRREKLLLRVDPLESIAEHEELGWIMLRLPTREWPPRGLLHFGVPRNSERLQMRGDEFRHRYRHRRARQ